MYLLINFLATYLIFIFPLLGIYFFFIKKNRILVFKMIFAFLIERILEFVIKTAWFTPRPYVTNHLPTFVTITPIDSSFPSGHTMAAYAVATVIFLTHRRLGVVLLLIAGIIGIARIFANVHFPVDVFSGLLMGVTIGIICDKINPYGKHRHHSSKRHKNKSN